MFTGIIESVGQIQHKAPKGDDVVLTIEVGKLDLSDVKIGDSIAVNGVCLTVVNLADNTFEAHVSLETLSKTSGFESDTDTHPKVNLEKALRLSDRLGGHLVSGHVDGIGEVTNFESQGDCWLLAIDAPVEISKYIAVKGSICVNGVSLTVNTVDEELFTINLIPHTLQETNLSDLKEGDKVNLEVDLIARYIDRNNEWEETQSAHTFISSKLPFIL